MGNVTFGRPPLVEVSFGIVFERLAAFSTAHFGMFWHDRKNEFPETVDMPPLGLGLPDFAEIGQKHWFPTARVWLVHRNKQLVMQLQADRILLNWRRVTPEMAYPRFEALLPLFLDQFKSLSQFTEDNGLGALKPAAYELTYVNHIIADEKWSGLNALGKVLVDLEWKSAPHRPSKPTGVAWQVTWPTQDLTIRADIKTAQTTEGKDLALVEVKAEASAQNSLAIEGWFRGANAAIVTAFTEMTTSWAQDELWQREK